jgi:hypothetical protein
MMKSVLGSTARLAGGLGRGLMAGVAATAAMSLSTAVEMRLTGRPPSSTPVAAAGKALGVQPRSPNGAKRFGTLVHWAYGTVWGAAGGVLRHGVGEPFATAAHFGLVWGTEVTLLPAMGVTPPVTEWSPEEIVVDVWHHLIYVAAFAGAWALLDRYARPTSLADRVFERAGDYASWVRDRLAG